jgi:hypothetical protein
MDIISWCGPLEVRLNRATNVKYGMLCNGWGIGRVGQGSGQGGYCPFFKPASPYAGLDFVTHYPPKRLKIRVGIGYAGWVETVWVCEVGQVFLPASLFLSAPPLLTIFFFFPSLSHLRFFLSNLSCVSLS